jgi:hypothetical protein
MFSIRSLNRRISFIKLRGMCGNNHNLIVLEADGTCPICKDVSNKAAEHSVQRTAKWSGHYETCPANNGGSCTCGY